MFVKSSFDFSRGITAAFCNFLCCIILGALVAFMVNFASQIGYKCQLKFLNEDVKR